MKQRQLTHGAQVRLLVPAGLMQMNANEWLGPCAQHHWALVVQQQEDDRLGGVTAFPLCSPFLKSPKREIWLSSWTLALKEC